MGKALTNGCKKASRSWPFWLTLVLAITLGVGYWGWTHLVYAQSYGGNGSPNQENQATITIQTKCHACANSWQTSGTRIAAGGLASGVHQADVQITITDGIVGHPLTISLDPSGGGNGFQPTRPWWSGHYQIKATIVVGGQTFTYGDASPITITASGTTITALLTSSNFIESATVSVSSPDFSAASASAMVAFVQGSITTNISGLSFPPGTATAISLGLDLDGIPIDGHDLRLFINEASFDNAAPFYIDQNDGYLQDMSPYVQIGPSANNYDYDCKTTDTGGQASATTTVVQSHVTSFTLGVADLAVATQ